MLADGGKADIHKFRYGPWKQRLTTRHRVENGCRGKPPPPESKNNLESMKKKKREMEIAHD